MNTNQSKRKKEFNKEKMSILEEKIELLEFLHKQLIKLIDRLYTDNTQFFGEDYQADYPLTK